jgi:EAL domain-containing protein (putative c-di-GMP-specific phosphodiesterase class I)
MGDAIDLVLDDGRSLKLAVNLSTRHFEHPELLSELKNIARQVGSHPRLLELELSERGLMHHPRRILRHLREFRRLGIRAVVDDFGTD